MMVLLTPFMNDVHKRTEIKVVCILSVLKSRRRLSGCEEFQTGTLSKIGSGLAKYRVAGVHHALMQVSPTAMDNSVVLPNLRI